MAEFTDAQANRISKKPLIDGCKPDTSTSGRSRRSTSRRRSPARRRTSQLPDRQRAQIPQLPPPVVLPSPLAFSQGQQGLGGVPLGGGVGALGGGGLGFAQQRPPAPLPPELLRLLTAQGSPLVP